MHESISVQRCKYKNAPIINSCCWKNAIFLLWISMGALGKVRGPDDRTSTAQMLDNNWNDIAFVFGFLNDKKD